MDQWNPFVEIIHFDHGFGQYPFQGLVIAIEIGFVSVSPLSIALAMIMWESSQWFLKKYCAEYWLKELQESMDRCTGCCDISAKNSVKHLSKQTYVFMCLKCKSFKNAVGKGEIAHNEQFLLFPQHFLSFWTTFCHSPQSPNYRLQILSVWKSLTFVVWERVNSLPNDKFLNQSKLKVFADNKLNLT